MIGAMEAYKKWVRRNRDYVHSMESLANGMTWLLPERFSTSEIGPEAVTSILGIITAINQHIIDTAPTRMPTRHSEHASSWPLCISIIKDSETLIEVVAEQFYGDRKWDFVALTEAAKVFVRLALFTDSGYKMLLHGGEEVNVEKDPSLVEYGANNFSREKTCHTYGPRGPDGRGTAIAALARFGENTKMASEPWSNRFQYNQDPIFKSPASVIEKPSLSKVISEKGFSGGLFVIAEVLYILRPLIYVLLIRRYGIRPWKPWLLSLVLDIASMGILSWGTRSVPSGAIESFPLSSAEKEEVKRRKLVWALYVMRDPFFTKYTRDRLEGTEKVLAPVPFVGFLTAKLVELIVGAQTRYTYTSGS